MDSEGQEGSVFDRSGRAKECLLAIGWAFVLASLMLSSIYPTKEFAPLLLPAEFMYGAVFLWGAIMGWSKGGLKEGLYAIVGVVTLAAFVYGLVLVLPGLGNPLGDIIYSTALLQAGFAMVITAMLSLSGSASGVIARAILSDRLFQ